MNYIILFLLLGLIVSGTSCCLLNKKGKVKAMNCAACPHCGKCKMWEREKRVCEGTEPWERMIYRHEEKKWLHITRFIITEYGPICDYFEIKEVLE
jgi:hypothetical protein